MNALAPAETDRVRAIATEVFAGMVDRQPGLLTSWSGGHVALADPLHAWVGLSTEPPSRVQLTTDAATAVDLARALLRLDPRTPVTHDDVVDAFGEVANIFGGSIKGLLQEHVVLTLPEVSRRSSEAEGARLFKEVVFDWRGCPFITSLWWL